MAENEKEKMKSRLDAIERHVVLVAPEVHWNTGNIGRTCLGAGSRLHLIRPLGFSLDDKHVRRAGLDYWQHVDLNVWDNFDAFLAHMKPRTDEMALFSKQGEKSFWMITPQERQFLVFGSETKGLPREILDAYPDAIYHIPISKKIRCLNLSTAVGIVLYETLRHTAMRHEWL